VKKFKDVSLSRMEEKQIGFLAWKGRLEDGFNLVWPQYGYVMRGRRESGRGFRGLMEDLEGYGPAYRGHNLRMGAFRMNGWCILVDTMLDKMPLERAARRLSVNFKDSTIAALADSKKGKFYIGYWDRGRSQGFVESDVAEGSSEVDGTIINGETDPSKWSEYDWAEALKNIGLDMSKWNLLGQDEAEFEVIEVRREFVPELHDSRPQASSKSRPWWKIWA
jgi:hypothetical protein